MDTREGGLFLTQGMDGGINLNTKKFLLKMLKVFTFGTIGGWNLGFALRFRETLGKIIYIPVQPNLLDFYLLVIGNLLMTADCFIEFFGLWRDERQKSD